MSSFLKAIRRALRARPRAAAPRAGVRARRDGGFSLLETMFSLTVLLIAMTVLYEALLTGGVASKDNKLRHRALQDISSLTEQMSIVPLANLSTTFEHDVAIAEFDDLHLPDQEVRVLYEAGAGASVPPINYEVVATWTSSLGRTERLVVRGVRAR
jgi:prepilin-type N-terminal cleavage/methylation domain-containing protein